MTSTAQLKVLLGTSAARAARVINQAEQFDVQQDFATAQATQFRQPRAWLAQRAAQCRAQASLIFGSMDAINAELERREAMHAVVPMLSAEARAAVGELRLMKEPAITTQRESSRSSGLDFRPGRNAAA